jgi:CubicO group peptidase (beta-lactamase class C family)
MRRIILSLLLVFLIGTPSVAVADTATPAADWPTAAPEIHGFDSALLADGLVTVHEQVPTAHSLLLVHNGELVLDAAFFPYDGSTPHDMASVTKSFMTTLIGIAIDQGVVSLDDTVLSFFPDRTIANVDARKEALTVGDLASNRTGLACFWQPGEPTLAEMEESEDFVQFSLDLPMVGEPGEAWDYCSPGMHLLSAILTQATGLTALAFAQEHLFGPLGIEEVIWPDDPQGYTRGWGDLILYPQDAAKLGQLFLDGGRWNGQQVVSEQWVEIATSPLVQTSDPTQSYGYGWWVMNESDVGGEIKASGRGGQTVALFPALDLVAMITGGGDFGAGDVLEPLVPALHVESWSTPIPDNPEGLALLDDTVTTLRTAPPAQPVTPAPDIAMEISGRVYTFDPNPAGWETLQIDALSEGETRITITYADDAEPPLVINAGMDGVYRFSPGEFDLPMASQGGWENDTTFVAELLFVGNINSYTMSAEFQANSVVVEITDLESGEVLSLEGMSSGIATPVQDAQA